jgi:hypothetical protein
LLLLATVASSLSAAPSARAVPLGSGLAAVQQVGFDQDADKLAGPPSPANR